MKSSIKVTFLKILVMIIFIMASLSVTNLLALVAGIRPQTVISYLLFGIVVSWISNIFIDKAVLQKEDPLSDEIIHQLKVAEQEREVIKDVMKDNFNITSEEIKVRAKVGEYVNREENKDRYTES